MILQKERFANYILNKIPMKTPILQITKHYLLQILIPTTKAFVHVSTFGRLTFKFFQTIIFTWQTEIAAKPTLKKVASTLTIIQYRHWSCNCKEIVWIIHVVCATSAKALIIGLINVNFAYFAIKFNFQSLYNISSRYMLIDIPRLLLLRSTCKAYVLEKHHCDAILNFNITPTTRPLQLIHSYLCGLLLRSLLSSH